MTDNPALSEQETIAHKKSFRALLIGCIGVVYGDIGTSPLYAFREAAHAVSGDGISRVEIFGIVSLVLWALVIIVTLKYVLLLMRADNKGEGGILSLMALAYKNVNRGKNVVFFAAVIGAALFYGDAAITPAISVMSAVEGLKLATPSLSQYVLPISVFILTLLFIVQKTGTAKISVFFGPVTALWFCCIGLTGALWIIRNPLILLAFNPVYAVGFLADHGQLSLLVLGAVFLSVTGAEALYADLGHFGRKPIQIAWLYFVFPALALNYLGQGAMIIMHPETLENPFFLMVPGWALLPMVILATAATIIASQAVITGAFSLTRQAIQLGLLPRMEIRHTSAEQAGQIYIPKVSRFLYLGVLFLCIAFRESSALASAYGISVTGTMVVTSVLALIALPKVLGYSRALCAAIILPFLAIELVFLAANLLKFMDGGFLPVLFGLCVVVMMVTWVQGSRYLHRRSARKSVSIADLLEKLDRSPPHIVQGTAIFLTSDPRNTPEALMKNLRHNQVMHEKNIILTVAVTQVPYVMDEHRMIVENLSSRITRVILNFGYMETPDVYGSLLRCRSRDLDLDVQEATFFLGSHKIVSDPRRGLPAWQDKIYIALSRTAVSATDFYRIPPNQVVEMGSQVVV